MKDWRFWLLLVAALALVGALSNPIWKRRIAAYPIVAIVDITRSMNVEDISKAGKSISRLAWVKTTLKQLVRTLPCGSSLGLGVFCERRAALLLEPIEVCRHLDALDAVIEHLDWRIAWAADSRISAGLWNAMWLLQQLKMQNHWLIFFTDGHEAPPFNPRYLPDFTQIDNVAGMIVGVGGTKLTPIPKFDETGRRIGFYTPEDVPHRSTFGLPGPEASRLPGYDPRNAPFGGEWVIGQEHLSSRKDDHLRYLAQQAKLQYHVLEDAHVLLEAIRANGIKQPILVPLALWPALASLALSVLASVYLLDWRGRKHA